MASEPEIPAANRLLPTSGSSEPTPKTHHDQQHDTQIPETHLAATLPSATAALVLKRIPTPRPRRGEVLIRSHALAIQPLDAKMHNAAYGGAAKIESYPAILGTNVAGVVVAVGEGVEEDEGEGRVKVGDRVYADTGAYMKGDWRMGGWQEYVIAEVGTVALIGDAPFSRAVLLGFPLQSAVAALKEYLSMGLPGTGSPDDKVLIWGGSGAVGSCAIQYAKSVGHTITTTHAPTSSTPSSHLTSLGATHIVDSTSSTLVDTLRALGPYRYILNAAGTPTSHQALAALLYPPGGAYASMLPAQNLPEQVKCVYTSFSMSGQKAEMEGFRRWWYGAYLPQVVNGEMVVPGGEVLAGGLGALQEGSRRTFEGVGYKGKVVLDPSEGFEGAERVEEGEL